MAKQLYMDKLQQAPATGSCTGGILGKLEIIGLLFISPEWEQFVFDKPIYCLPLNFRVCLSVVSSTFCK